MITEDYVSFETAKLLKEKGFNEPCLMCYNSDKKIDNYGLYRSYKNSDVFALTAPTLQMAMKWLRKKHNLHIIILPYAPIDRHPYHPGEPDFVYIAQLFRGIIPIDEVGRSIIRLTPEESCEVAINYCLENLI